MGIEANGGWLRLRFSHHSQRHCLYLGLKDTKLNRIKGIALQLQVQADIEQGIFDDSLLKYRQQLILNRPLTTLNCAELFAKWVQWKSQFCDVRTANWYTSIGKQLSFFGNCLANSINKKQVNDFVFWSCSQGKLAIQKRRLKVIESCWAWAIENDYLKDNPWKEASKLIKRPGKQGPKPFTKDEVESILEGFQEYYPELYPFVRFLLGTGCRLGEARALTWSDLNQDMTICEISRQLSQKGDRSKLVKNGKVRSLFLSESLTALLRNVKAASGGTEMIFQCDGQSIIEWRFYTRWKRVLMLKNIPHRKPYNCRHTFVSHALANGIKPLLIAQQTGHTLKVLFAHYAGYIEPSPKLPELF